MKSLAIVTVDNCGGETKEFGVSFTADNNLMTLSQLMAQALIEAKCQLPIVDRPHIVSVRIINGGLL